MGQAPSSNSTLDPLSHLSVDLPQLTVEERVGNGRFTKTYSCKSSDGPNVVLKVYVNRVRHNATTNSPERLESTNENSLSASSDPLPSNRSTIREEEVS